MKKTNPLKIVELENIANNIRKECCILPNSPFPILKFIENLCYKGIITIQYMEDDNPLFEFDTPAKYNPIDNFIYVKESVLEELENHIYRANFTLAHELFHFFQCKIFQFEFEEVDTCPSYCNPEWQANEFAGQLLVPTQCIKKDCDTFALAKQLCVTEECILTRKLYYEKRKNYNKNGIFRN